MTLNSADLEWKPPANDGGAPIENYVIEMKPADRKTWSKAGKVNGKTTTFKVDKLIEGTEYLFKVTAINKEGESPPLEATETIKPQRQISE